MPDRHAGTLRCLHPPECRERVVEQPPAGYQWASLVGAVATKTYERCLDCRAVRRQVKQRSSPPGWGWGPWVSAGAQVKATLLGQGQERPILSVSGNWLVEKK